MGWALTWSVVWNDPLAGCPTGRYEWRHIAQDPSAFTVYGGP